MLTLRLCYRVTFDAYYKFLADDGWAIASHIALSALMSLFPFLILVTALAGFLFGSTQLADEVAVVLDDEGQLSSCPRLATHRAHHRGEAARLRLRTRRRRRIPAAQPGQVGRADTTPHLPVTLGDRPTEGISSTSNP